jgi:phage tail sheath protein FI
MPEYLAPGVYIEEISVGPKPIEGVSTSTAGFLGPTERGPEYAKLVTSWLDFTYWYGGYIEQSYLPYAVQGFFDNGGKRCYIARVVRDGANSARATIGNLSVVAVGRGSWGNNIRVKVEAGSKDDNSNPDNLQKRKFKVTIFYYVKFPDPFIDPTSRVPADLANPNRRNPDWVESWDNLTVIPGDSNNVETIINSNSYLVRVEWTAAQELLPVDNPPSLIVLANGDEPELSINDAWLDDFKGNLASVPNLPDKLGAKGRGLAALEAVDDVSIVIAPDEVRFGDPSPLTQAIIDSCTRLKDRFAIISARQGSTSDDLRPPQDTTFGAFYFPWIRIYDAKANERKLIPPTGHVAGIYARTDIERGVHKAPANEVVRGAFEMEFPVSKEKQDVLNPKGVNCIRDFRPNGRGIRLWGARTMSSDPEWKYVNVRRLFLYLEESIDEATQWVVFEPNAEPLWARVKRSIDIFLIRVWLSGALMGTTQEEAFFVKCDRTTMTQDDIDNGRLICLIGVAPVKPAEFVIFRFFQKTAEAPS